MNLQQRELFRVICNKIAGSFCPMNEAVEVMGHVLAALGRSQGIHPDALARMLKEQYERGAKIPLDSEDLS